MREGAREQDLGLGRSNTRAKVADLQVAAEGMGIARIHNGKIQEMRVIWDIASWLLQETERPGIALRCRRWWC